MRDEEAFAPTDRLRAERSNLGTGRVYTITYRATDACGKSTEASATVTVPLERPSGGSFDG